MYTFAVMGLTVGRLSAGSDVTEEALQESIRESAEPGFFRDGILGMAEYIFEPAFAAGRSMTWVPEPVFESAMLLAVLAPLVYNIYAVVSP